MKKTKILIGVILSILIVVAFFMYRDRQKRKEELVHKVMVDSLYKKAMREKNASTLYKRDRSKRNEIDSIK